MLAPCNAPKVTTAALVVLLLILMADALWRD